jgi:hypothetical protein
MTKQALTTLACTTVIIAIIAGGAVLQQGQLYNI